MQELQGQIGHVGEGDLNVTVGFANRKDYIGDLGRSFNHMVQQSSKARASAGWAETHQRTQAFHSGITERMLIRHLQEFVADGIVKRDDKKTIPPCVYYSLSSYGRTLGPVVQLMCSWGRLHLKRLSARR